MGGWQGRIGRNYGGFIIRVGLLFEAPAQPLEVGARHEPIAMGAEPRGEVTVEMEFQAYTVAEVTHERAYNHAAATKVRPGEVLTLNETLPEGTYVVRMAQSLGRLAAPMLEPETEDNVVYWNLMDAGMRPTPLPTRLSGD